MYSVQWTHPKSPKKLNLVKFRFLFFILFLEWQKIEMQCSGQFLKSKTKLKVFWGAQDKNNSIFWLHLFVFFGRSKTPYFSPFLLLTHALNGSIFFEEIIEGKEYLSQLNSASSYVRMRTMHKNDANMHHTKFQLMSQNLEWNSPTSTST